MTLKRRHFGIFLPKCSQKKGAFSGSRHLPLFLGECFGVDFPWFSWDSLRWEILTVHVSWLRIRESYMRSICENALESSDFTWRWAKWPLYFVTCVDFLTGRTKTATSYLTSIFWEYHDVFCSHGWSTKKTLARSSFKDENFRCWVGKCFLFIWIRWVAVFAWFWRVRVNF